MCVHSSSINRSCLDDYFTSLITRLLIYCAGALAAHALIPRYYLPLLPR